MPWRRTAALRVAEVRDNILSLVKTVSNGFHLHFGSLWLLDGKRRQKGATFPGTKQFACGGSCVGACIESQENGTPASASNTKHADHLEDLERDGKTKSTNSSNQKKV